MEENTLKFVLISITGKVKAWRRYTQLSPLKLEQA
jgi:hypothetical protein